jgi:hypothetical protein
LLSAGRRGRKSRQCCREAKVMNSISIGLCPQGFKSPRGRYCFPRVLRASLAFLRLRIAAWDLPCAGVVRFCSALGAQLLGLASVCLAKAWDARVVGPVALLCCVLRLLERLDDLAGSASGALWSRGFTSFVALCSGRCRSAWRARHWVAPDEEKQACSAPGVVVESQDSVTEWRR